MGDKQDAASKHDPISDAAHATYEAVFKDLPADPDQIARVAQIIGPAWREVMTRQASDQRQDAAA